MSKNNLKFYSFNIISKCLHIYYIYLCARQHIIISWVTDSQSLKSTVLETPSVSSIVDI